MTIDIKGLDAALLNAVRPAHDIHITCPNCHTEQTVDNGEWLLWCGEKHHAEAILEAARRYARQSAPQQKAADGKSPSAHEGSRGQHNRRAA